MPDKKEKQAVPTVILKQQSVEPEFKSNRDEVALEQVLHRSELETSYREFDTIERDLSQIFGGQFLQASGARAIIRLLKSDAKMTQGNANLANTSPLTMTNLMAYDGLWEYYLEWSELCTERDDEGGVTYDGRNNSWSHQIAITLCWAIHNRVSRSVTTARSDYKTIIPQSVANAPGIMMPGGQSDAPPQNMPKEN